MNSDDVLATLAEAKRSKRPTELKSDSAMLKCWLSMRNNKEVYEDVILRHGLDKITINQFDIKDSIHEHAYSNAWGHCMQWFILIKDKTIS